MYIDIITLCTKKYLTLEGGAQMQITNVRLNKTLNSESKMKAVASVTFDNEFVVHGIKIIDSPKGLFIAMPSREKANGEHKDIAHPSTKKQDKKYKMLYLKNMKLYKLNLEMKQKLQQKNNI